MTDVSKLSDAELVAAVAEKVMGWYVCRYTKCAGCDHWVISRDANIPGIERFDEAWRPLDDWNDAMMVVEAMRAKGFCSIIFATPNDDDKDTAEFWPTGKLEMVVRRAGNRRAILEAALMAVEGK